MEHDAMPPMQSRRSSLSRRSLLSSSMIAMPVIAARPTSGIQVIAHRGEHVECPENTIPAIEKAIAMGADWVELDIRTTRDGEWVLMHNATVDATTNGKGAVAEMDFANIVRLDAGARKPKYAGTPVPSFDHALEAIARRAGLYLDAKAISAPAIIEHLKRHNMLDRCVVYGGLQLHRALKEMGHGHLCMPEAVSVEVLKGILAELAPKTIAFDARDLRDEVLALAIEAKTDIFVDRLGGDDNEASWRDAIRRGATGIQTDRPEELVKMLRGRA